MISKTLKNNNNKKPTALQDYSEPESALINNALVFRKKNKKHPNYLQQKECNICRQIGQKLVWETLTEALILPQICTVTLSSISPCFTKQKKNLKELKESLEACCLFRLPQYNTVNFFLTCCNFSCLQSPPKAGMLYPGCQHCVWLWLCCQVCRRCQKADQHATDPFP